MVCLDLLGLGRYIGFSHQNPSESWSNSARLKCILMATLACTHSTTILTNHEPFEVVAECIFYSLRDEAAI